jgi:hypothetical protein
MRKRCLSQTLQGLSESVTGSSIPHSSEIVVMSWSSPATFERWRERSVARKRMNSSFLSLRSWILKLSARAAAALCLLLPNLWMVTTVPICPVLADRVSPFSGLRRGSRLRRFHRAFFGPREGVGRPGEGSARKTPTRVSREARQIDGGPARIMDEPPAATGDLAVLPGVLGSRTLRRTGQVRLRSEPLRLPGGTPISTISLRCLVHNAG